MRGHQARLSPTSEQAASLHQWTGAARFLWNLALEQRTICRRRGINKIVQCRDLTELRAEVDWILDLPAQVAQQVLADLDLAYQRWGVGLAHRPGRKRRFRNEAPLRFPQGVELRRLNRAGSRGTAGARQELTRTCSPRRCAPPAGDCPDLVWALRAFPAPDLSRRRKRRQHPVYSLAMPVAADVRLGEGVLIPYPELTNLYGCIIGAGTRIGPFVEIQSGAVVGERCKIQSHTFICSGVTIEDEVFVGHGVMFVNDKHPRAINDRGELAGPTDWRMAPTMVRRGVSIGSNATILDNLTIGQSAMVGAGAVVTRNVRDGAVVIGAPAREIGGTGGQEPG